jgi:hypothetical protein
MNLTALNNSFEGGCELKQRTFLSESLSLAAAAARDLRTHAYLLHPPLLDERGLPAHCAGWWKGLPNGAGLP